MLIRGNHESRQITQVGSPAVPGELPAPVAVHCAPSLSCHLHGAAAEAGVGTSGVAPGAQGGVTPFAYGWLAHLLEVVSSQMLDLVVLHQLP